RCAPYAWCRVQGGAAYSRVQGCVHTDCRVQGCAEYRVQSLAFFYSCSSLYPPSTSHFHPSSALTSASKPPFAAPIFSPLT
ncbi:unnamed protein product, partial [Staurois parvus]